MKSKAEKFDNYKVDTDMSMPQRIAAFLNWAAEVAPGRPVAYLQLARIVTQMPIRSENDRQVETVRKATRRAKPVLMNQYHRGVVSHPGFGVRATTGSEDVAQTQFQTDRKRVVNSLKSLDRTNSLVNVSEIRDHELKASVNRVRGAMKVLVSNEVMRKLLPEKSSEE